MADAYKEAGVDIEAGYESVKRMTKHVERTNRLGLLSGLGSFGGMFDLSSLNMKEPVLISGTDGVGTKLLLSFFMEKYDTIGIDAVAMCVNDIVVHGAEPLYFLDYLALGKVIPEKVEAIVKGIAEGCEMAGCALIGGETAEMPDMYKEEEFDIAGFAVGAVEKKNIITGDHIQVGDVLIGLSSSGIHSNGYSLVRKVLLKDGNFLLDTYIPELNGILGEELLRPTKIYVKPILAALKRFNIKGMAHITGGGFIENIPRMMPKGLGASIQEGTWKVPPIFQLLEKEGNIEHTEMFNVFNMGIGMVLAVQPDEADQIVQFMNKQGEEAQIIGNVTNQSSIIIESFGGKS